MITMGDEVRRTQRGNNNAYCQDNEISWFDWSLIGPHRDVHRFVALLCHRRLRRDADPERRRVPLNRLLREAKIAWHGVKVGEPDWSPHSHSVALSAELEERGITVYLVANAYWEPLTFALPPTPAERRGSAGSTRRATRRTTSSSGRRHRKSTTASTTSGPDRSSR